jgi:hypothetical protein
MQPKQHRDEGEASFCSSHHHISPSPSFSKYSSIGNTTTLTLGRRILKVNNEVVLLSYGNGDFTGAIGFVLDLSDKPVWFCVKTRHYDLLAEDGVVKIFNLEESAISTFSGADDILKVL